MASKIIELRPDRNLLQPSFDGYKLSLEQLQILTKDLETPVDRLLPSINQYSLLHAKLFGLHNHLIGETEDGIESVYFVDKSWKIQKTYIDPFEKQLSDLIEVWQIPTCQERQSGNFNVSIKFASESIAVVANGIRTLYIVETGMRKDDDTWKTLYSTEDIGTDKNFILQDVSLKQEENGAPILHLLLLTIEQEPNEKFSSVLNWITLSEVENKWDQVALRQLKTMGIIHYAYFEKDKKALYVISDKGCNFTLDSENPIVPLTHNKIDRKYKWYQTAGMVTIDFTLLDDTYTEGDVFVKYEETNSVEIKYKDTILISGLLWDKIDNEESITYSVDNNKLRIKFRKRDGPVIWWQGCILGDEAGKYIWDGSLNNSNHLDNFTSDREEIPQTGTTFNSQEVEECDFEDDKSSIFERLCLVTHQVSHKASLGSHQVLITANLSEKCPPAFGIRHDVDVCLWQPQGNTDNFNLKHEGSLYAFGYIQASKQQRKFSVCSPDLTYSAICESVRHLFIYRQNKPVSSGELRNRTSRSRINNIAQQQVVTIPNEEVLGIYSTNSVLFFLTEKSIFAVVL